MTAGAALLQPRKRLIPVRTLAQILRPAVLHAVEFEQPFGKNRFKQIIANRDGPRI